VHEEKGRVIVIIEDNGIGIKKSKEQGSTSGTEKGEQMLMEQVKQINKLYDKKIEIEVVDLINLQSNSGTKIIILL